MVIKKLAITAIPPILETGALCTSRSRTLGYREYFLTILEIKIVAQYDKTAEINKIIM